MSSTRYAALVAAIAIAIAGACGSDPAPDSVGVDSRPQDSEVASATAAFAVDGVDLEVVGARCITEDQAIDGDAIVTLELGVDATGQEGNPYVATVYRTTTGNRTDEDIFVEVADPDAIEGAAYRANARMPTDQPLIVEDGDTFTIETTLTGFELDPVALSLRVDCSGGAGD